ncbi:MAG: molybdopterin-guanine dinucleotide biosynthesis protein B [Flavobacteriaceae bacterium]
MSAVFGVTGWKNSGKTTLATRLIGELSGRGYRVSSVKHAHHSFDIDHEGTDSHRHREAGAGEVALVSGRRWALMRELRGEEEPTMREIIARMDPCDIIIVEGYKREDHPKIEARRLDARKHEPLATADDMVVAIASDHPTDSHGRPVFAIDDIREIADFIVSYLKLPVPTDAAQTA